jgi:hypothetical protein
MKGRPFQAGHGLVVALARWVSEKRSSFVL